MAQRAGGGVAESTPGSVEPVLTNKQRPRKRRPRMPYLGIRDELTHHSFSIRDFYSDAEFAARCVAAPASLEALGERIAEKLANKDYFGRRAKKHLQSVLGSLFKEIKKRAEAAGA